MPFSVCILVHQWHAQLPRVLTAAQNSGAEEILLGLNGSFNPDSFPELKRFPLLKTKKVVWRGYGATKNELAAAAKNEWILSLDMDEMMDEELQTAIKLADFSAPNHIYTLKMVHYLGTKPLRFGAWGKGKKQFPRLYNRNFTQWNTVAVHEQIAFPPTTELIPLQGSIKHFTSADYTAFLHKNKHYAHLAFIKYRKQGKNFFPGRAYLSAAFNFLKEYIFLKGFLDGRAGWQIAKGNALYTYWKYHGVAKDSSRIAT